MQKDTRFELYRDQKLDIIIQDHPEARRDVRIPYSRTTKTYMENLVS